MRIPIPFHRSTSPEVSDYRSVHDARGVLTTATEEKYGVSVTYTERTPHDLDETKGTVIVVPGLYGLKWTYGDFRDALAETLHARVRTYRHARRETNIRDMVQPGRLLHPAKVGGQSVVCMIDSAVKANPAAPAIVLGHSKGGPDAADGVLHRTEDVSDTVFIGSGGLEEGQSIFRLATRIPGVIAKEIIPGAIDLASRRSDHGKVIGEAVMHGLSNPWRLAGEVMDVANRPLMTRELFLLRHSGVRLHAIQFERDGFFPLERATARTPGLVDTFSVIPGVDHLGPQREFGTVAAYVADALNQPQVELAIAS